MAAFLKTRGNLYFHLLSEKVITLGLGLKFPPAELLRDPKYEGDACILPGR